MDQTDTKLFISHSHQDIAMVSKIVDICHSGLGLSSREILCTSLSGYHVPIGESIVARLRSDGTSSNSLLCLVTPNSLASQWVMFELGARWGVDKHLVTLLAGGATVNDLPEAVRSKNAAHCSEDGLELLFDAIADELDIQFNHKVSRRHIRDLVALNQALPHLPEIEEHSVYDSGSRSFSAWFTSPLSRQVVNRTVKYSIEINGFRNILDKELWLVQIESGKAWPKKRVDHSTGESSGYLTLGGTPPGNVVVVSLAAVGSSDAERIAEWYELGEQSGSFPGFTSLPDSFELDSVTLMISDNI